MMKRLNPFYFVVILLAMVACETIDPDFTYSPEMPKAGEKITFTNLTGEGEYWNWTYGDGGYSIVKNPTYTYKKPGVYDITLRVDSNDRYTVTKQIIVYDTIPSIYLERDTVDYYQLNTFNVLVYNPYKLTITYDWTFPATAQGEGLVNLHSDAAAPSVFFTENNVEETILLTVTVGDSVYQVSKTIYVQDVPTRSMLIAVKNGNILRQRIFDNGLEDAISIGVASGKHPFNIRTHNNQLFVFDAGTHVSTDPAELSGKAGDGSIRKIDFALGTSTEIIHNRNVEAVHGFYNGFVDASGVYWTDQSEFVYKLNSIVCDFDWRGTSEAQTSVSYYLAKVDRLGYFNNGLAHNQLSGGFYFYDDVYFWAKGGTGKGLYRFVAGDILSAHVVGGEAQPAAGAILTDCAIRAFDIDHLNQKIYYSVTAPAEKIGLWVANLSGTNAVRIDDAPMDDATLYITGIEVDNYSNKVYWAYRAPDGLTESYFTANPTHRSGVKYVRLARNLNVDKDIRYFNAGVEAYGIALDEVAK